jgi:hypothetical protein
MKAGVKERVGVALGKRVALGNRGVGVGVELHIGVRVGVLTGDLVFVGEPLGEGVSLGVGTGTQATCSARSRVKSAARNPLYKSSSGRLLRSVCLVPSVILTDLANRSFLSKLQAGDLNLLLPHSDIEMSGPPSTSITYKL